MKRKPELVGPHVEYKCLWRVRWPDGVLSDLTNLTRAKDAIARYYEAQARRTNTKGQGRVSGDGVGRGANKRKRSPASVL